MPTREGFGGGVTRRLLESPTLGVPISLPRLHAVSIHAIPTVADGATSLLVRLAVREKGLIDRTPGLDIYRCPGFSEITNNPAKDSEIPIWRIDLCLGNCQAIIATLSQPMGARDAWCRRKSETLQAKTREARKSLWTGRRPHPPTHFSRPSSRSARLGDRETPRNAFGPAIAPIVPGSEEALAKPYRHNRPPLRSILR